MKARSSEKWPLLHTSTPETKDKLYPDLERGESTSPASTSLSFVTYNVALFPRFVNFCGIHIPLTNFNDYLPPNEKRIPIIKEKIVAQNPDIFAFQEAWDKEAAKDFIQFFGQRGYNYVNLGFGWTIQIGGLMLFSKLPLIDSKKIFWTNNSFPVEWWGGKGAIAGHYKFGNGFITVGTFHQPGGCSSNFEVKFTGTSSYRRGQNFDAMLTEFVGHEFWQNPGTNVNCCMTFINAICNLFSCCRKPKPEEPIGDYRGGIMMGDHNLSLDIKRIQVQTTQGPKTMTDNRKHYTVSLGMAHNGFEPHDLKYGWVDEKGNKRGQWGYFLKLISIQPGNFEFPRQDRPDIKGAGKQLVDVKVEQAIAKKFSTGTNRNDLKEVTLHDGTTIAGTSPQEPNGIIDGMYQTQDCADRCKLTTQVLNFDGVDEKKNVIAGSDHYPLGGTLDFTQPAQEPPSIYAESVPQPTNRRNPSEGCWQRFKSFFGCHTSPTIFTLKPSAEIVTVKDEKDSVKSASPNR